MLIDNIKSIPSTSAGISSTLGNTRIRYNSSWFTDDVHAAIVQFRCPCALRGVGHLLEISLRPLVKFGM